MKFKLIFIIISLFSMIFSQNVIHINGKIHSISSQNIYVKFDNTSGISVNDTLYQNIQDIKTPVLIVDHISTKYLLTKKIGHLNLNVGDDIFGIIIKNNISEQMVEIQERIPINNTDVSGNVSATDLNTKQQIDGRISLTTFANYNDGFSYRNSLRIKPRISFDARNLGGTKFSLTSYINSDFRQKQKDGTLINTHYTRIYDLAMHYDFNNSMSLVLGRKINPNISNLGVIDGLQLNKKWDNFIGGFIVGSHPNYDNFGLDINLLEAGLYIGYLSNNKSKQSALALIQQMNGKSIDRRSLYLTHQNRITDKLNYYLSGDIDLYKKLNGIEQTTFRLTGLYFSTNYKPLKTLSISTSFNSRKNIIYYETYKSYAEQLYNDETRNGFKMRINWKPLPYTYLGINTGYRLKNGDSRSSYNYSGYLGHSNVPIFHIYSRLTVSYLKSNYLDGRILDIYFSKVLFNNFVSLSTDYKYIDYEYIYTSTALIQHQLSSDLTFQLKNRLSFSLSLNRTIENNSNNTQITFVITQRF